MDRKGPQYTLSRLRETISVQSFEFGTHVILDEKVLRTVHGLSAKPVPYRFHEPESSENDDVDAVDIVLQYPTCPQQSLHPCGVLIETMWAEKYNLSPVTCTKYRNTFRISKNRIQSRTCGYLSGIPYRFCRGNLDRSCLKTGATKVICLETG